MRKNALVICCVSYVFGAFGAFFRWLQDMTGFEADTGLYIVGGIWSRAIVAACIGVAAVLLVLVLGLKKKQKLVLTADYAEALKGSTVLHRPASYILAGLLAVGALMLFFTAMKDPYPGLQFGVAFLGLLAAGGFLLAVSAADRRWAPALGCLGVTLLIVLYCFWLVVSYRENAVSPSVWGYAMEILALSCVLIAVYYIASVPFGRPKPFSAIFFSQLGAFLCIVTLPDSRWTGQQVMLAATTGILLFFSWTLLSNLRPAEAGAEPADPRK